MFNMNNMSKNKMLLGTVILTIFVFHIQSSAMTARYIETKFSNSIIYNVLDNSYENEAPYAFMDFSKLFLQKENPVSSTKISRNDLTKFEYDSKTDSSLKTYLLSSVLLFHMGDLGVHNAYDKAKHILEKAAKEYPHSNEVAWLKGLQYINTGNVTRGILLLDSLRLSGFAENEFLSDYAKSVFHAFVPGKRKNPAIFPKNSKETVVQDTTYPTSFKWNVTAFNNNNASLPSFDYSATFFYRKPFKLDFDGLSNYQQNLAILQYPKMRFLPTIPYTSGEHSLEKNESARLNVYIDLNDTQCSLYDYLRKRIDGKYDSIVVKKDLSQYDAVSLRCYRNSLVPGQGRNYTAYVTFDRRFCDIFNSPSPKKARQNQDSFRMIRFTVTMESPDDIQPLAEAKLQNIIRAF